MSQATKMRYQKISTELANNYLEKQILLCRDNSAKINFLRLNQEHIKLAAQINPEVALHYLLSQLLNQAKDLQNLSLQVFQRLENFLTTTEVLTIQLVEKIIWQHINQSDYAARIMEIAMHSLMQAMQEYDAFPGHKLKPLSQMRSANKKHGNVADIEILSGQDIIEAWDAKYGKAYLRDEIEELADKLQEHPNVDLAGFVTSVKPERWSELDSRCQELEDMLGIYLKILTFEEWVKEQLNRTLAQKIVTEGKLAQSWLVAYVESLAQRRRNIAPVDEPCYQWLKTLKIILENLSDRLA